MQRRMMAMLLLGAALVAGLLASSTAPATAARTPDGWRQAPITDIPLLFWAHDSERATVAKDDPMPTCATAKPSHTLWFGFERSVNSGTFSNLYVRTWQAIDPLEFTKYPTVLAAFTRDGKRWREVACDKGSGGTYNQSQVTISSPPLGQVYYFMMGDRRNTGTGGYTDLEFRFDAPATYPN